MAFTWTEEQEALRASVLRLAERELNDDLQRRDAEHEFPRAAWQRCADMGLLGLPVPEAYGGGGADPLTIVAALEALGRGCRDNGLIFSLNAQMWSCELPLVTFGTDDQKRRHLPGLCGGSRIGVQAMTEPGSGSDAFSLSTTAQRRGQSFVLNGTKTFVTNAPVADLFVVFASTHPRKGFAGVSAFLVERDMPGVQVGAPFHKMGLRTSPMSELVLTDCHVPDSAMLGGPGGGLAVFTTSMDWERSFILAASVGTMQRQLDECVAYARGRTQFGQPIGKFQGVSHRIVDMALRLKTARLLVYDLAWQWAHGKPGPLDAALVKLHLSECFTASSLDALHVHGAYGYMEGPEWERDVRDALASRIYSGTSEIQRNIVASRLGL